MQAAPRLQNIFTLEPVVHLKDLLFAVVDGALTEALDVAEAAGGDTQQNLMSCLEVLQSVEGEPLVELTEPLAPYRFQLEFAFLTLVRQAFIQHCVLQKLAQETVDVQLVNDDLDKMTGELVSDILRQVCKNCVVQDLRYFAYQPINKCVLVDQACRQGLHQLVVQHVRFVVAPRERQGSPGRDHVECALETPSEVFPHHSASNVCTPTHDQTTREPTFRRTPESDVRSPGETPEPAVKCVEPHRPKFQDARPQRPSPSNSVCTVQSTSRLREAMVRMVTPRR